MDGFNTVHKCLSGLVPKAGDIRTIIKKGSMLLYYNCMRAMIWNKNERFWKKLSNVIWSE